MQVGTFAGRTRTAKLTTSDGQPVLVVEGETYGVADIVFSGIRLVQASDGVRQAPCTFTLPDVRARRAWGIDVLNGTEQELGVRRRRGTAIVAGVLVKDAPMFVRYTV